MGVSLRQEKNALVEEADADSEVSLDERTLHGRVTQGEEGVNLVGSDFLWVFSREMEVVGGD